MPEANQHKLLSANKKEDLGRINQIKTDTSRVYVMPVFGVY